MKRLLARNMLWNWSGIGVGMVVGFAVAPFLVHKLGETGYGLWILISSFTNYFGLLDLGIRGSVGRTIAYHRARKEAREVNATLNTALLVLAGAGAVALLGTIALVPLFPRLFTIPADHLQEAQLALVLVGVNLALWLPLNTFDATLWGYQRFDVLNAIDIPMVLARAGLTFYFIGNGHGLVALALINLFALAGAQALKAVMSFRLDRALRLRFRECSRAAARGLYKYGIWYFIFSVTRMMTSQMSPIVISALLGVQQVAVYSIASRLIAYAGSLLGACTGVLTPVATALHAEEKTQEQQRLLLTGTKYCWALSLCAFTLFLFLGAPLVTLWMGPGMAFGAKLLVILALGEVLPMSQQVTQSMILGMARHRALACLGLIENALAVVLAVVLSRFWDLLGVCVGLAVAAALCRGVAIAVYGCRLARVPVWTYVARSLIAPLVSSSGAALLLALLVLCWLPTSWPALVSYGALYGLVWAVGCGFLVGYGTLRLQAARLARGLVGSH